METEGSESGWYGLIFTDKHSTDAVYIKIPDWCAIGSVRSLLSVLMEHILNIISMASILRSSVFAC